jgi:hypothetical protein
MKFRLHSLRVAGCWGLIAVSQSMLAADTAVIGSPDPIAAGKRDIEAIEASRAGLPAPSGRVRVSLPPIALGEEVAPLTTPIQRARKDATLDLENSAKTSENWLLDAMGLKAPGGDPLNELHPSGRYDTATKTTSRPHRLVESGKAGAGRLTLKADSEGASIESSAKALNPLNAFLASWMTTRDLQLLQPEVSDLAQKRFGDGDSMTGILFGSGPSVYHNPSITRAMSASEQISDFGAPPPNPYLLAEADTTPAVVFPALPSSGPNTPVTSELSLTKPFQEPTPLQPTPAPSTVADQLKISDDQKYFKQLKRF